MPRMLAPIEFDGKMKNGEWDAIDTLSFISHWPTFADKPNTPAYVAHIGRLKITTSLNVKLSVNAFVQVNSLARVSAANFRLRYNSKDGNDFYLVYNETVNNKGSTENPFLPFSDYRALVLKYIYTFHLGR